MPRKSVPPQADFGRALQQLRAARGVTQEDMLSTTTRAQQVADAPLPATSHAAALLHEAEMQKPDALDHRAHCNVTTRATSI